MPIKASESASKTPTLKVLLHGDSGTGKTSWAAKSPRPLFLLTEPQGAVSVQTWAPDALIEVVDLWPTFKSVWMQIMMSAKPSTLGAAAEAGFIVMEEHEAPETPCCGVKLGGKWYAFQTLVIDGLTDLQRMLMAASMGVEEGGQLLEVDPKVAPKSEYAHWKSSQTALLELLRNQRALPCNVVCTALSMTEDGRAVPALQGNMVAPTIGQFFNAVGWMGVSPKGEMSVRWRQSPMGLAKPGTMSWPERSSHLDAGDGTLGSLALLTYGGQERLVPHGPSDAAERASGTKVKGA